MAIQMRKIKPRRSSKQRSRNSRRRPRALFQLLSRPQAPIKQPHMLHMTVLLNPNHRLRVRAPRLLQPPRVRLIRRLPHQQLQQRQPILKTIKQLLQRRRMRTWTRPPPSLRTYRRRCPIALMEHRAPRSQWPTW